MAQPEPDVSLLEEQIAQLRADMTRIAETLAALGQTGGATLKAALAEKAGALQAQSEERLAGAGKAAEATLADVTDYARRNPAQAMAMAGGAGLLLGLMFGRRS